MLDRLLVNVEEGSEPLALLEKAARLALSGGQLELFCCVSRSPGGADESTASRTRHALMTQCEGHLDHLAERIRLEPARLGSDVCWDRDRIGALVRKCERYRPDLLIHPAAEASGLLHPLILLEDRRLLRQIQVPLLLARKDAWGEHPRIAVALDPFHPCGEPAALDGKLFGMAHGLARQLEGELHVLHTYQSLPQSAILDEHRVTDYAGLQKKVTREHQQRLEALLAGWQHEPGAPQLHLLEGEFHRQVVAFCSAQPIDLLLIGNVPRGLLDRLLLGSSAERVLERIRCDLLVVKPDG